MFKRMMNPIAVIGCLLFLAQLTAHAQPKVKSDTPPSDWISSSPRARDEICPKFAFHEKAGRDGKGAFAIQTDERDYLHGYWYKKFPVEGGQYYRVEAWYKGKNIQMPRRAILAKILWRTEGVAEKVSSNGVLEDDYGQMVARPVTAEGNYQGGSPEASAEDEFLVEEKTDAQGWHKVAGVYWAPKAAKFGVLELSLKWSANSELEWSQISWVPCEPPAPRIARLAAIHFDPSKLPNKAKTTEENLRLCEPYINEAGKQKADLVVLGEHIASQGVGISYKFAEPIPGPSTRQLGQYAKANNLYIVAGLIERNGHKIQPVAVLIGPDGELVGKYNKTALAACEVAWGDYPGSEYPVFNTRFGKVGMMICYDGEFTETSRQLAENGAEVIAWPCYGNPWKMAQAHAMFNQVYVVMSTYMVYSDDPQKQHGISGVFNREGDVIAAAKEFGTVAIAEVDLNKRTYYRSIGDVQHKYFHERPVWKAAP